MHDLSAGFRSEKVCSSISAYVGKYIESNVMNFDGSLRNFIRVRVLLDIRQSLKQRMRMKRKGGE